MKRPEPMDVMAWLLDADPAIRWQVMSDLTDRPAQAVASERSLVATTGWGARLLSLQDEDGNWGGGAYSPKWTSTTYTLLLLRHLGADPDDPSVRSAIDRVRDRVILGREGRPFFGYRGETCITGMCLALASYFKVTSADRSEVIEWLLAEQLDDGGWNCDAPEDSSRSSFNTTISILEGLFAYERANGADPAVAASRDRAHSYLLERRLMRSLSTGEIINPRWRLFSFPPRWHYDVLRGLEYLREAGVARDERLDEAVELVVAKQRPDGRWPLQNHYSGREHFRMEEGAGKPSRWNTLRALRVLDWAGSGPNTP